MITFAQQGQVATLTMDDGKLNVVNTKFAQSFNEALDQSEDAGAIVIQGRAGMFSAGFDLKGFQQDQETAMEQVRAGLGILIRLFSNRRPVVACCEGHGIGMGAFLLMACDYRIGEHGEFKYSMPESKIGLDLNDFLIALAQSRLSPKYLTRMAVLSEDFGPENALKAGIFDELAARGQAKNHAKKVAQDLAQMPKAFGSNKLMIRQQALETMQAHLNSC